MEGYKVVTAEEMARVEKISLKFGGDLEKYMETAGRCVAEAVIRYIEEHQLVKEVTLLVGKGNNGGDAYAAGCWLLEEGFQVSAYALSDEMSPLNRKFREKFRKKRGRFEKNLKGTLVDGLFGTGLKGAIAPHIAKVIAQVNDSKLPVIAIDIPSGLSGTTGKIQGAAIKATETIALGMAKIGLFSQEGWQHVGRLRVVDFGLSKEALAMAEALCYLPKRLELPTISRVRNKYQAGYVVGYAGSHEFSGAAKMASFAALKAGAGIVRLFYSEDLGPLPWEIIGCKWGPQAWKKELERADAAFVGPGLKASPQLKISIPCVFDASALLPKVSYPKGAILTPHRGEVLRLLGLKKMVREEELFPRIVRFCKKQGVYVVLKGAPTFIFSPKHKVVIVPRGDPGMATAGTGDVLTGMIAALLAQGCGPYEAALLGVTLHAIAGERAAAELTSYCMTATDLIAFMPVAFHELLQGHDIV